MHLYASKTFPLLWKETFKDSTTSKEWSVHYTWHLSSWLRHIGSSPSCIIKSVECPSLGYLLLMESSFPPLLFHIEASGPSLGDLWSIDHPRHCRAWVCCLLHRKWQLLSDFHSTGSRFWGLNLVSLACQWPQGTTLWPGLDGIGPFCSRALHFPTSATTLFAVCFLVGYSRKCLF